VSRPLSLLDLTPILAGSSSAQAVQTSVELAMLADRLGYHRVWYAEHHNSPGLASGAPEIMIEHVASRTSRIRVGAGGVMLPNHAPLKIAETFRLLEALHPGRIDLGLGRAPGTDTITAFAMRRSAEALTADDYPEQLAELLAFDDGTFPGDHPFRTIRPVPVDTRLPPVWLLGSSDFSARLAAQAGLGYAFAAHINGRGAVSALRDYRASFVPSERYPEPWAILTVSVTVGETAEHARELSLINDLLLVRLRSGQIRAYPTLEEAKAYSFTAAERHADALTGGGRGGRSPPGQRPGGAGRGRRGDDHHLPASAGGQAAGDRRDGAYVRAARRVVAGESRRIRCVLTRRKRSGRCRSICLVRELQKRGRLRHRVRSESWEVRR
jgi:luciferase family oxidoreductase group 1